MSWLYNNLLLWDDKHFLDLYPGDQQTQGGNSSSILDSKMSENEPQVKLTE